MVCGGGVVPELSLAQQAGLLVEHGGIPTDARMRTERIGIFAVGDIAYAFNAAAGRHLRVEHWGDATSHGRIAGAVAAGGDAQWEAAPGFWSEIGGRVLKYASWGDGWDQCARTGRDDHWVAWYGLDGVLCGVLSHGDDEAYARGRELLEQGATFREVVAAHR